MKNILLIFLIVFLSSCDLKVSISKEKRRVDSVEVHGQNLSREEINSNF